MKRKNKITFWIVCVVLSIAVAFIGEGVTNNCRSIPKDQRREVTIDDCNCTTDGVTFINEDCIVAEKDNATITFCLKNENVLRIRYKKDAREGLIVTKNGEAIRTLTGACSFTDNYDISEYTYNLNCMEEDITIIVLNKSDIIQKITIDNRYRFNWYVLGFIFSACIIFAWIVYFAMNKRMAIEKVFLVFSLSITIMYAVLLPLSTGVSWDEHIHFAKVATLQFNSLEECDYSWSNRALPMVKSITSQTDNIDEVNREGCKDKYKIIGAYEFPETIIEWYNNVAYVPAAVIRSITGILGAKSSVSYIAGRLINGILYSIIMFFSIRRLRTGKLLLSVIGLSPLAVFIASVYSYDWWVTAFCALGCAYLIRELQDCDTKFEPRNIVIMLAAFVIGCGPKAIYFMLVPLCLLVKTNKFSNKKHRNIYRISIILVTIGIIATFMLPMLIGGAGTGDARGGSGVNATEQIAYIFNNPIEYTGTLIKFIIEYISPSNLADLLMNLGFVSYYNDDMTILIGFVMLAVILTTALIDYEDDIKQVLCARNRCAVYVSVILTIVLIITALYITFCPVGSKVIKGVQGRYLLPLFFPAFYFVPRIKINAILNKEAINLMLITIPVMLTMFELGWLLIRHYY